MTRERGIETYTSISGANGQVIEMVMLGRPQLNKSLLFTSQSWINPESTISSIKSYPNFARNPVNPKCVRFADQKGRQAYIITEANHRLAVAIIYGMLLEVEVTDVIEGRPLKGVWGFNLIINQVNNLISSL